MNTVGSMLKEGRVGKRLSLEEVEAATKIRKKFLEAIEADDYTQLPSLAYAKGFVKNYSDFLGLSTRTVVAFFRRQTQEIPKSSLLPKSSSEPFSPSWFRLTPARYLAIVAGIIILVFLTYFLLQYRVIQEPPPLSLTKPLDGENVSGRIVEVLGTTDPDATALVNGVAVLVRADGKFFDKVAVTPGENTITVSATSRFGKESTISRTVMAQTDKKTD